MRLLVQFAEQIILYDIEVSNGACNSEEVKFKENITQILLASYDV